ncbi:MAG: flagellar assembly protein FliW [Bryobacteraceae bacterium]
MPSIETKYFGTLPYGDTSVFDFPQGWPAYEDEKSFVPIAASQGEVPGHSPLLFLQSMVRPNLCFVAFPILVVDGKYELAIAPEDLEELGLEVRRQPALSDQVMVLALISSHGKFLTTANLMAPVVLNVKTRRRLQAIRRDSRYSHAQPIGNQADYRQTSEEAC